jgi:hypothetical protein
MSMMITLTSPAIAEHPPNTPIHVAAAEPASTDFGQMLYKGVVGNVLEKIPMDADQRLTLQRTNAVISNTFSGRSLSLLMNATNPVLMIGGIVWGLWAASNIKPGHSAPAGTAMADTTQRFSSDIQPEAPAGSGNALVHAPTPVLPGTQSMHVSAISTTESTANEAPSRRVIKLWPTQP